MKKQLLLCAVAVIVMTGCNKKEAKPYSCKKFSAECEFQKDRVLLHPVAYDPTLLDAYGYPILSMKTNNQFQWYIVNPKAKALVPVRVGIISGGDLYDYPSPDEILLKGNDGPTAPWRGKLIHETIDISQFIPGVTSAVVIMTGPNELVYEESYIGLFNPVRRVQLSRSFFDD